MMCGKKLCRLLVILMVFAVFAGCAKPADPAVSDADISDSDVSGFDLDEPDDEGETAEPFVPTVSFAFNNLDLRGSKKPLRIVGVAADGSTTFDRTFSNYYNEPLAYAETPDDGLIIAVATECRNRPVMADGGLIYWKEPVRGELVRLDKDGKTIWKYPLAKNIDIINRITVSPDGDIYTAGIFRDVEDVEDQSAVKGFYKFFDTTSSSFEKFSNSLRLMRITPDGLLAESLIISPGSFFKFYSVETLFSPRGELVVLTESSPGYGTEKVHLRAYDDKLEVVWESLVSEFDGGSLGLYGNKIIVGDYPDTRYAYFSLSGKLLETHIIHPGTYAWGEVSLDAYFVKTNDGELFLCRDGEEILVDTYDAYPGQIRIASLWDGRFIVQVESVHEDEHTRDFWYEYSYYMYDRDGNPLEYIGWLLPNGAPYPLKKDCLIPLTWW